MHEPANMPKVTIKADDVVSELTPIKPRSHDITKRPFDWSPDAPYDTRVRLVSQLKIIYSHVPRSF